MPRIFEAGDTGPRLRADATGGGAAAAAGGLGVRGDGGGLHGARTAGERAALTVPHATVVQGNCIGTLDVFEHLQIIVHHSILKLVDQH